MATKTVLFVENDKRTRNYVSMILECGYDCDIVEFETADEALKTLNEKGKVDLIISNYKNEGGNGTIIYKHLQDNELDIPFVLFTSKPLSSCKGFENFLEDNPLNGFVPRPFKDKELFDVMNKTVGESAPGSGQTNESELADVGDQSKVNEESMDSSVKFNNAMSIVKEFGAPKPPQLTAEEIKNVNERIKEKKLIMDDFMQVRLKRLFTLDYAPADIYISLSDKKFLKIFNNKKPIENEVIDRYIEKKVKYFYILKKDYGSFLACLVRMVIGKLKSNKIIQTTRFGGELAAYELVLNQASAIGLSDNIIELGKEVIDLSIDFILADNNLADYFKNILSKKNFLAEHSLLTSYVASKMALEMDWKTEATLKKISLGCMLHEVGIKEPFLAKHRIIDDELTSKLKPEELEEFKNHPHQGAEIVKKCKNIYPDVDSIIAQHHELPDGSGFPRGLHATNIAPMSCLFIMAEDFTHRINNMMPDELDIAKIKEEFEKTYDKGNFKKPLKAFLNSF